ncbi:MAG: O-antigen ligase family protein [Candidatus Nealsonbacteria bacterium]
MKDKQIILPQNRFRWFYLIGFFLILSLPLLNLPPWFTPIGWGKTIVFRIILSILVFLFLGQILYKKVDIFNIKNKIKSVSLAFWLLVALFGIYLLATIFSLDPHFSLWGNPYRSGGFVNFSFYIIFAVLSFLVLRKLDWQKIWNFAILIGIFVSIFAVFQWQGLFKDILITYEGRPFSTFGNPIMLAIYLLLLSFLTLSFGIQKKNFKRKIFYFSSFLLFLFIIIFLAKTRAVYIGLVVGFLWFLFFYPKRLLLVKVFTGILLILGICGIYYINTQSQLPQVIQENKLIRGTISRLSIKTALGDPRISSWKVSWEALKARPVLGYGPENFMIAFDKYYDTSLLLRGVEWWDRAHNFIFDIPIAAGIPALIIYLSLFGTLFWQLQKVKRKRPETAVICHGIQATFVGYLIANLSSFDTFSSYLISFLLISYSLHLISNANLRMEVDSLNNNKKIEKAVINRLYKYKKTIIFVLLICLIWFIWSFNLKPFQINKDLNLAIYFSKNEKCEKSLKIIENISSSHSIIDNYLRLKCAGIIQTCTDEKSKSAEEFAKKAIQLLKKNIEIHPYYTRNWLLLAEYTNVLMEKKLELNDNIITEEIEKLKNEANYYFEKAHLLSPKHQEIFTEWSKTNLITGEYQKAKEKAQQCINLNPNSGECYWLMALIQAYLENSEEFNYFIALAQEKDYNTESKEALSQLLNMYMRIKNYQGLAETYPRLISITSDKTKKAQLYASLAVIYKELGDKGKAREVALKALELDPKAKPVVDEFLRSLEQ